MAIRKVVIWPDPVLSQKAAPVVQFDESLKQLVIDMFDTMYDAHGVGLAAPQVGISQRVLVIDLSPDPSKQDLKDQEELKKIGFDKPLVFINPEITTQSGRIVWEEGCLSVPGISEEVTRAETLKVRAQDVDGQFFEKEVSRLYAVAIQHEIDHLDGKVFVEYLSRLKRDIIKRKMIKIRQSTSDYYKEHKEDSSASDSL